MMSRLTAKFLSGRSAFQQSRDDHASRLTLSVHSCEMRIHKLAKPGCGLRKSVTNASEKYIRVTFSTHRDDDARNVCANGFHETPEVFANGFHPDNVHRIHILPNTLTRACHTLAVALKRSCQVKHDQTGCEWKASPADSPGNGTALEFLKFSKVQIHRDISPIFHFQQAQLSSPGQMSATLCSPRDTPLDPIQNTHPITPVLQHWFLRSHHLLPSTHHVVQNLPVLQQSSANHQGLLVPPHMNTAPVQMWGAGVYQDLCVWTTLTQEWEEHQ